MSNENRGYLMPNASKKTDKQADYRGRATFEDAYWVSGWFSKSGDGSLDISFTNERLFKAKQDDPHAKGNRGSLSKNARKTSDNHPDWRGECSINGKKLEMAAWESDREMGGEMVRGFLSVKFSEPRDQQQSRPSAPAQSMGEATGTASQPGALVDDVFSSMSGLDDVPF